MKKLVVFYSLEGSTKSIAEAICEELKADILELKPLKNIDKKGFFKFIWGGKQVLLKEKPALESINKDIQSYDFIIIGTPVWAGGYAPVFNTFFTDYKFDHKRVALFCCHDGSKGHVFEKLRKSITTANIVSEIDFKRPSKDLEGKVLNARNWIKSVVDRLGIL